MKHSVAALYLVAGVILSSFAYHQKDGGQNAAEPTHPKRHPLFHGKDLLSKTVSRSLLDTILGTIIQRIISGVSNPTIFIAASGSSMMMDDLSLTIDLTGIYLYGLSDSTFNLTSTSSGFNVTLSASELEFDVGTITMLLTVHQVPVTIVVTKTVLLEDCSVFLKLTNSGLTISTAVANTTISYIKSSLNITVADVDVSDSANLLLNTYFSEVIANCIDDINTSIGSFALSLLNTGLG